MYIKKVEIKNIRSIESFTMEFHDGQEPGWHVLIGDNGAGKSSIVRSIAAALIGPEQIGSVRLYWDEWLSQKQETGSIKLELAYDAKFDKTGQAPPLKHKLPSNEFVLRRNGRVIMESNIAAKSLNPKNYNWGDGKGWFSVAYGPFRRFTGGNPEWNKVYYSAPKAGAHLSVFGEDIALTEALEWLKDLDRRRLKEKESALSGMVSEESANYQSDADLIYYGLRRFINESGLLPHKTTFAGINLDGEPEFIDGNGNTIKITQLSDGYRSILSMTFELIRQLIRVYGAATVFQSVNAEVPHFKLPGVVLIDEIDAHLHPTWQTRIGQWFTLYFPQLQFIVTTHSPLICRAAEKGSIWRLAAPGSKNTSGPVTGEEKDKLVYGDVLDAYDTDVFGEKLTRGKEGVEKQEEYRKLVYKENYGLKMSAPEKRQLKHLKSIFHTDVATDE
ncbi:MAG TPA: AAA family ATPase [Saprospiraceae bacterium]|nr:AAA family ATPase [Saprospiraceae bacterium]HNM23971.1 AAA family ATPase [Saprospiraceae bacterium]